MLLPRADRARRHWFVDARDDGRRMELSWHPDERMVVVSLWHGDVCRATFRLPVEQAGAVIGVLSAALTDAATSMGSTASLTTGPGSPGVPAAGAHAADGGGGLVARVRRRWRGQVAEVVELTGRRR